MVNANSIVEHKIQVIQIKDGRRKHANEKEITIKSVKKIIAAALVHVLVGMLSI